MGAWAWGGGLVAARPPTRCTPPLRPTLQAPNLLRKYRIDLQVLGITNSSDMILGHPLNLENWQRQLVEEGSDASLGVLTEHLKASSLKHKVVIDCTASGYVPQVGWGWGVVVGWGRVWGRGWGWGVVEVAGAAGVAAAVVCCR